MSMSVKCQIFVLQTSSVRRFQVCILIVNAQTGSKLKKEKTGRNALVSPIGVLGITVNSYLLELVAICDITNKIIFVVININGSFL